MMLAGAALLCHERHCHRAEDGQPESRRVGRTNRGATAQRNVREAVLQGTRTDGILLLRLAQTARGNRAGAVRFGGKASGGGRSGTAETVLELVLATGERLRIGAGVDAATLRTVLDALRA